MTGPEVKKNPDWTQLPHLTPLHVKSVVFFTLPKDIIGLILFSLIVEGDHSHTY